MKFLALSNSAIHPIVDDWNYVRCAKIIWHLNKNGYISGRFETEMVLLHRFILWMFDDDKREVDHKHGILHDCRESELRVCNSSQNKGNSCKQKRKTSSKYKGVHFHTVNQNWIAQINRQHIGAFLDEKTAAKAYDLAALQKFGEFAKTNFG